MSEFETKNEDGKVYARYGPDQSWMLVQKADDAPESGIIKALTAVDGEEFERIPSGVCVTGMTNPAIADYTKSTPPKPVMSDAVAAVYYEASEAIRFLRRLEKVDAETQADRLHAVLSGIRSEYHFPVKWDLAEKANNGPRGHGDSSDVVINDPNGEFVRKR